MQLEVKVCSYVSNTRALKEKKGAQMRNKNLQDGVRMLMSVSGIIWDQSQVSQGHGSHGAVLAKYLPPQIIWFCEGIIRREKIV